MNKAELIDAMASDAGLSKADAKRALNGLLSAIGLGLSVSSRGGGGDGRGGVYIGGFGAFLVASNTVCNPKDNDCNGRFDCSGSLCGGVVCDGVNFNPLATAGANDGVCTGIDDDCDIEVLDDGLDDKIDFFADPAVEYQMGKFYYYYWINVVLELANQLDIRSDKSYSCANPTCGVKCPDGSCVKECNCGVQGIRAVSGSGEGNSLSLSLEDSPSHYEKGDFMSTVAFWMREFEDVLDPDSDGDGLGDSDIDNLLRASIKDPHRGHVTVLKARLQDGQGGGGVLTKFSKRAGLSPEMESFVRGYFDDAIAALEASFDPDRYPMARMDDDTELIVKEMAKEVLKGYPQEEVRGYNPFEKTPIVKDDNNSSEDLYGEDQALRVALVALQGFINVSTNALKKGDKISLVGFGSFSISKRAARTGRNPQTGKEIKIAAKNVVKFKAGADLSKKVN